MEHSTVSSSSGAHFTLTALKKESVHLPSPIHLHSFVQLPFASASIHGFGVCHLGELQDLFSPGTLLHELICCLKRLMPSCSCDSGELYSESPRSRWCPAGVLIPPASSPKPVDWPHCLPLVASREVVSSHPWTALSCGATVRFPL